MSNGWFDPAYFERLRQERGVTWGRPLRLLDTALSTNDSGLAAIATEQKTGIVWLARHQTGGRGRRGHAWFSEPGENLTVSTLLRIPGPPELALGFPLLTGLAVRALIAPLLPTGRSAQVKWPNDVLIDGKKCAGVLVESRLDAVGRLGIVVGVGLNVLTCSFPAQLPDAISLLLAGAERARLSFEVLLVEFLRELEQRTRIYLQRGLKPLLDELAQHDFLAGREIRVGELCGHVTGFDERGRLQLVQPDGRTESVEAGHVELLTPG